MKNICFQGRTESLDLLTQLNLQIWNILFKEEIGPRWVEVSQWPGSCLRGNFLWICQKVKLPIYFELKFKIYGHWCIRNLSHAQDFINVTLAYEDDWRILGKPGSFRSLKLFYWSILYIHWLCYLIILLNNFRTWTSRDHALKASCDWIHLRLW